MVDRLSLKFEDGAHISFNLLPRPREKDWSQEAYSGKSIPEILDEANACCRMFIENIRTKNDEEAITSFLKDVFREFGSRRSYVLSSFGTYPPFIWEIFVFEVPITPSENFENALKSFTHKIQNGERTLLCKAYGVTNPY
ncbi:hypothetical protein FACS1894113_2000 [Alphaproteobacteria bacterium]|nr:hypothetical protein FACS1894113_2000 [Alphaproteobacteria bacterium]